MELDSEATESSQDLQWKLTTHFLPAMPRKYFSVRSHTSRSSGREQREVHERLHNRYTQHYATQIPNSSGINMTEGSGVILPLLNILISY